MAYMVTTRYYSFLQQSDWFQFTVYDGAINIPSKPYGNPCLKNKNKFVQDWFPLQFLSHPTLMSADNVKVFKSKGTLLAVSAVHCKFAPR